MVGSRTVLMFVLGLGMAGALATPAMAQQGGGGGGGRGGRGGGAGGAGGGGQRFDPAAMMQRREQQLKDSLGVTDEEWTALQPKLQKVQEAQATLRAGTMFGMRQRGGGPGGGGPAADTAPQGPVAIAAAELRTTLDNKESTPDQIKAKLQALRDAKDKANADVTAAQAELKSLLTARQEAVLVSQGVLN